MKNLQYLFIFTLLLTFFACSDDGDDIVIEKNENAGKTVVNSNRNTSGPSEAQGRLEFPKLKGGMSTIVVHKAVLNKNTQQQGVNYCVEWDPELNAQRWSCYQLYSSINYHSSYNVSRYSSDNDGLLLPTSQYPNDADMPKEYQWTEDPYKYSGYDHGHICPSADRLRATEANYQTFFITNMQPQYNKFNAGLWEKMEGDVRNWVSLADTLYVCKGGTIDSSTNVIEYVKNGSHQSARVNSSYIPVPRYFFMAVLSRKGSKWQALGYWVEHINKDRSNDNRRNYAVSIDRLEELTGLDFFCNLPDDIENEVERTLVQSFWGL